MHQENGSHPLHRPEVVIHGLGAAIGKATKLALSLVERSGGTLYLSCTTTTVTLHDEYEPLFAVRPPLQSVPSAAHG